LGVDKETKMALNEFRHVKSARKPHSCEFCGRTIGPGKECFKFVGVWDNEIQNWYICVTCYELYCKFNIMEASIFVLECPRNGSRPQYEIDTETRTIEIVCPGCSHERTDDLFRAIEKGKEGEAR
jgi:hypothetical protein